MAQLKLTPVHSGDTKCSTSYVEQYVRKHLSVGNDFIDVDRLNQQYLHLEPIALKRYSYVNVEMIMSQDMLHKIRPMKYFETDRKGTPKAVRHPLVWVLSGPRPSISGLFSTCF